MANRVTASLGAKAYTLLCQQSYQRYLVHRPFVQHQTSVAPRLRQVATITAAKKASKKGGGDQKKGGSVIPKEKPPPYVNTDVLMHNLLLIESFSRQVGRPMMEDVEIMEVGKVLWEAPFGLISHNKYLSEAPTIVYANKVAQEAFECDWEGMVGSSVESKRPEGETTPSEGSSFTGWFNSSSGQKLMLPGATVWKVEGPSGVVLAEAVLFVEWEYADGRRAGPAVPCIPSEEEVQAAERAVESQAALVRELKDERGLTNKDIEVQDAVSELLQRKEKLEELKKLLVETA